MGLLAGSCFLVACKFYNGAAPTIAEFATMILDIIHWQHQHAEENVRMMINSLVDTEQHVLVQLNFDLVSLAPPRVLQRLVNVAPDWSTMNVDDLHGLVLEWIIDA